MFEEEGEFKKNFAEMLALRRETETGVTLQDAIDISLELVQKALQDFPFNIYFDNAIGGKNHYSFHLKNKRDAIPSDIDEVTRGVAEWVERQFFGIKEKKGLYLVNPDKKPSKK